MDTPEKPQMATSLSKFEDSPVFNYINSLSPIKPVKSIPITQIFNPPCFSSLPSVFTSPHVSSQSHKESRFLKRHNCSDLSNREIFSSETGDKVNTNEGVATAADQLYDIPATLPPDFDQGVPTEEANLDMSTEHSVFTIELPRTLKYDCGSPDCDSTLCGNESEFVGNSALVIEQATGNCLNVVGTCQTEQKNEATGCDWESMLMDAADLLFFNSPGDSEALKGLFKSPFQPCIQSIMIEVPRMHTGDPSGFSEQLETGDCSPQSGETLNLKQGSLATSNQNPLGRENDEDGTCIPFACQPKSNLQRGFRRRCLDFEMAGGRRRNLNDGSNYNENIMSKDKLVVPTRPRSDSSRCILSGIGLHLNALAIASRDNKVLKNESIKPEQQNLPSSTVSFHSLRTCERSFSTSSTEIGTEPGDNGVQLTEDSSQTALYLANEEFNQNSPKKKRRRTEQAGESESSCKRCNCKKSKCLKLYCECFAAGVYCVEPCACQECFNKPIHEETVLATRKQIESRNPLAFAPKVIRGLDSAPEIKDDYSKTPASARHKRGCNCKKSSCLKKYCECYQGGVGCSVNCRCEGCKNAFGRKDGSVPTETEEEEEEEDETEKRDMVVVDKAVQKTEIPTKEPRTLTSAFPITPLQLSRPLIQLPFSSMNKHSLLATGSSSSMLYNGQKYGKPNIIRSQSKLEKHLQTVPEDEMPEILQKTRSPTTGVKSASPNSKRITPPHHDLATSPSLRSSRKLILQSIPSFPSLTPKH